MIWNLIIPLSASGVLLVLFVLLMLPRPKNAEVLNTRKYLGEAQMLAQKLVTEPTLDNVRALRRPLGIAATLWREILQGGTGEIESAYRDISTANDICKSLITLNASRESIAVYAPVIVEKIIAATKKSRPLAAAFVETDNAPDRDKKDRAETVLRKNAPKSANPPLNQKK